MSVIEITATLEVTTPTFLAGIPPTGGSTTTGAAVHSAFVVIDPTTDLTTFTTTDIIDPITWATIFPDFARGYLVGRTVAISSGANIGLYTVTASGPCTPLSPQPEVGEQIAVLVGDGASPAVVIAGPGPTPPTEYRGVKGVVRSVNGGTGAVVVDAASVGADPAGTAASAISALGLGTAATKNVPATGDASATEVVKGDDTRLSDARTPTAHKSSHARGGSDVLGVGHFAPDLPGVLGTGVRVGPNVTLTRGMCVWVPLELLAIDVKVTSIWIKIGTGVASGAVTAGINAAKSATLDAPGTLLASTSAGAISTAATGTIGGSLTAAQTLTAGVRYFVQLILLGGASNPTVQSADGILGSGNWEKGATAPVTPTAGPDTMGAFVWSGRTGLESDPPRASYVSSSTKPFVYLSLEAP